MTDLYVFGKRIPDQVVKELTDEFGEEELTTEFLESLFEYEYRDNL